MSFRTALSSVAIVSALAAVSHADVYTVGSIQGQNGWSGGTVPINTTVDQGITTAAAHTGLQSWHISNYSSPSNPVPFGIFGGMPFAPGLSVPAGQPSEGTAADTFEASLWIKIANPSAAGDGSYIQFDFGDSNGGDRNNFFALRNIADANGGVLVRAAETLPDGSFTPTQTIASGLDRSIWHQVVLTGHFLNGDGNDYFTVSLDGSLLNNPYSGSPNFNTTHFFTFEGYWNQPPPPLPYQLTNRMYFQAAAGASAFGYSDTAPQGFYVDDLTYRAYNSSDPGTTLASFDSNSFENALPEPTSMGVIAMLGALAMRRRRHA